MHSLLHDHRPSILSSILIQDDSTDWGIFVRHLLPCLTCLPMHSLHNDRRTSILSSVLIQDDLTDRGIIVSNNPLVLIHVSAQTPTNQIRPARPALSAATCIAFPSLFQSPQHNTHPVHFSGFLLQSRALLTS